MTLEVVGVGALVSDYDHQGEEEKKRPVSDTSA